MKKQSSPNQNQGEVLISIVDFWRVLKEKKKLILLCALIGAFVSFYYVINKPITYVASATFKEKSNSGAQIGGGTMQALFGSVLEDNSGSATSLMQSELVMKKVVKKLNLQAGLSESRTSGSWDTIFKNIKVARALSSGNTTVIGDCLVSTKCILEDDGLGIECKNLRYEDEFSLPLSIQFISEERFQLKQKDVLIGEYQLDEPVVSERFSFVLTKTASRKLEKAQFSLLLLPLEATARGLSKSVSIKKDKLDKNLLILTYEHPNRHFAAKMINELMYSYKDYLREENERIVKQQLDYLEKREKEATQKVEFTLAEHSQYLKDHIYEGGFVDLTKELEFVGNTQEKLAEKILKINLELSLLKNDLETYIYSSSLEERALPAFLEERDEMESQGNFLALCLSKGKSSEYSSEEFADHCKKLEQTQDQLEEVNSLISKIRLGEIPTRHDSKTLSLHPLVKSWFEKLQGQQHQSARMQLYKNGLLKYLEGQKKILSMQQKHLEDHLSYYDSNSSDFQGISLDNAEVIYASYNEQRDEIQKNIRAFTVVYDQLQQGQVDVSSFSAILRDKSLQHLLAGTTDLIERLNDEENRSPKEQERLKNTHQLKKEFLLTHVKQSKDLLLLEERLLREKMFSLQRATLDVIHSKQSAIEGQLNAYRKARESALLQEKELLQGELKSMQARIAHLPERWIAEKLINVQTTNSTAILQEVTKLIEAKNISSNLSKIESTPIDFASPPTFPKTSNKLVTSFGGALIGAMLACVVLIIRTLFTGVRVSEESLLVMGQKVAGKLTRSKSGISSEAQNNLHVVRKLMSFLSTPLAANKGRVVTLIQGSEDTCSSLLATLLTKRGERVLVINGSLLKPYHQEDALMTDSFSEYLNESIAEPCKYHLNNGYDYVPGGTYSPYSVELLQTQRCTSYLNAQRDLYDWILFVLPVSSQSPEALALKDLGDQTVVVLQDEKLHEITPYLDHEEDLQHTYFVIA